jgi:hypothetical protein
MIHECTDPIVEETHDIRYISLYYYRDPSLPGGRNHPNGKFLNTQFQKEITSSHMMQMDCNVSCTPSLNHSA